MDFSIGTLDSLEAIGYYSWEEEKIYAYLGLQRTYDNWLINLSFFCSPEDENDVYGGTGLMCMVTYNH